MPDFYHNYRSRAVKRYLLGDCYTLERNDIFYPIGEKDYIPKSFYYSDFNYNGKYYFLLQLLPKEIWYVIFEMKHAIEKMEYVTLYFSPEWKAPELLYETEETKYGKLKYFKTNTIRGKMHNDFTDVLSSANRADTQVQRFFNILITMKEFINKWYFYVKEMVNNHNDDRMLSVRNIPVDELFFRGKHVQLNGFVKLYHAINSKIYQFEEEVYNIKDIPEERNKKVIAKILLYDIKQYAFRYLFDYNGPMDEPLEEDWRLDFFYYYFEFTEWVKDCGIESQEDLASFLEEFTGTENYYYYNPRWFEKDEDSDDFPLWVMIQEFC